MNQIGESEFRNALIATKKDAKLIAAARNDRMNNPETLYREFAKLPVERQRDIITTIAADHFVASQWKITFPLNNLPPAIFPDAIAAAGKALFFTRDEACVLETVRAIRLYQENPYVKQLAALLGEAAEITGIQSCKIAQILTEPEVYGLIKNLDPADPASDKILQATLRTAMYSKDLKSTMFVANFLWARRHSSALPQLTTILEEAIFMARDRRSIREIVHGLTAGGVDAVLQRHTTDQQALSAIRDVAWKTRNANAIQQYLIQMQNGSY